MAEDTKSVIHSEYVEKMKEAEKLKIKEKRKVVKDIKELIEIFNIEPEQLGFMGCMKSKQASKTGKLYRNPETGEYYNGYGRRPKWFMEMKDPESCLV